MSENQQLFAELFSDTPTDWKILPFQDVVDFQEGPGILAKDFHSAGIPLIRLKGIQGATANLDGANFLCEETVAKRWSHFRLQKGDLLLSSSASLGRVSEVDEATEGAVAYTGIIRMRPATNDIDKGYIKYFAQSYFFSEQIRMSATGSVINHFGPTHLKQMGMVVPSCPEQKSIAHILGTLDDKIELNRKTNETLEAMAKALFKSWFVDFDPVRAKAEGRPTGLPAEISDLFPDSFEDSELGEIPSGWQVSSLGEVIELAYGKPLKEEQRKGGAYPVFGSNGVVGSHDEYLVEAPGIVVGRKGNPGTVEWSGKNFYPIDTTFFVVNKKAGLGMRFLFYCLRNQNLADLSADSAVPGLNRNHAYMNNQLLPPIEVTSAFERHLEVIFKRREFLADEINALGETRDALLPKLISGEIRIPDAEKMLEEVGV